MAPINVSLNIPARLEQPAVPPKKRRVGCEFNQHQYDVEALSLLFSHSLFFNQSDKPPSSALSIKRQGAFQTQIDDDGIKWVASKISAHYFLLAAAFEMSTEQLIELEQDKISSGFKAFFIFLQEIPSTHKKNFYNILYENLCKHHTPPVADMYISSLTQWSASSSGKSILEIIGTNDNKGLLEVAQCLYRINYFYTKWEDFAVDLDFTSAEIKSIKHDVKNLQDSKRCLRESLMHCTGCTIHNIYSALYTIKLRAFAFEFLDWVTANSLAVNSSLQDSNLFEKVVSFLQPYRNKWEELALELDVSEETVHEIGDKYTLAFDVTEKTKKLLNIVRNKGKLSPKNLVYVLKTCGLNFATLQVATKYSVDSDSINPKKYTFNDLVTEQQLLPTSSSALMLFYKHSSISEWKLLLNSIHSNYSINDIPNDSSANLQLKLVCAIKEKRVTVQQLASFCKQFVGDIKVPDELVSKSFLNFNQKPQTGKPILMRSATIDYKDVLCLQTHPEATAKISILLGYNPYSTSDSILDRSSASVNLWMRLVSKYVLLQTGHLKELLIGDMESLIRFLPNGGNIEQPFIRLKRIAPNSTFFKESYIILEMLKNESLQAIYAKFEIASYISEELKSPHIRCLSTPYKILLAAIKNTNLKKQLWFELDELATERFMRKDFHLRFVSMERDSYLQPPEEYLCPITLGLIKEPILIQMNDNVFIYFDRAPLIQWLKQNPINPLTRQKLSLQDVASIEVDVGFKKVIDQWGLEHPEYSK